MKSLLIKFDTKRTKIFFGCAWIALVALWFFTTTDAATFQWAMQKGGITATEFGAFGKLQFMFGIVIGISAPIMIKVLKARNL
jgi:hypothetical protein